MAPFVAGAFELWITPTLSLSFVIESERADASLLRLVSRLALYFQPSLTRQALEFELQSRGDPSGEVIAASTLRVVDAAYYRSIQAQVRRLAVLCDRREADFRYNAPSRRASTLEARPSTRKSSQRVLEQLKGSTRIQK